MTLNKANLPPLGNRKKINHLEEQALARPPYSSSASLHMPLKVTLIFLIRALCYPDRPLPTRLGQ